MKPENQKMIEMTEQFTLWLTNPIIDSRLKQESGFKKVVFCGMGGSSAIAFVIKDIYYDSIKVPFEIVQGYKLPPNTNDESLVIVCSYSGNTEETISCLKEASKKRCTIVGLSSGGALLRECQLSSYDWVKLKEGIQPRAAFPNMFSATLEILENKGIIKSQKKELSEFASSIDVSAIKHMAQKLSSQLKDKVPVLYSSGYRGVLMRIKNEFNENTKIPCKFELYPELDHNDIVGWGNRGFAKHFKIIHIRSDEESPRMKQRIEITKKLLNNAVEQIEVQMLRPTKLEKALMIVLLFDFVSIYLAELYGTDAYSVEMVDKLKEELSRTK